MDSAVNVWDFLTFLWDSAMNFLNIRIELMGLNFSLWEFAFGSTVLLLVCSVVFRDTD